MDPDVIDEYSVPLGKLFRWLQLTLEVRKEDIVTRKEKKEKLK